MLWKTTDLSAWGRALHAPVRIARPERQSDLVSLLADTIAPAIGALRSYGDAALNHGGALIDMTRLDRLIDFDPATGRVVAEAGVRLGDLLAVFGPKGWMPAVVPGTGFVTVGGAIASDVHGKNHHKVGSFGQHVARMTLATADGQILSLSETENAALFRATIGGMGQTGIIITAELRLARCAGGQMQVTERRIANLDRFIDALVDSEASYSVGWVDATARGTALGRGILETAENVEGPFTGTGTARSIPLTPPRFAMSRPIVRSFNALYLRRVPLRGRTRTGAMQAMLFPLDRLNGWNKLYGKAGFHQFQCVLPDKSVAETLPVLMTKIADSGLASPLSVLKRLGAGRGGFMSFPMAGLTLAVDFADRTGLGPLMDALHEIVAAAGGRVYLAKDSVSKPELLAQMYPELSAFRDVLAETDPDARFETDLARRLNLRGAK